MINRNTQQKRIQVRGLSYVPSSRITKDGGCSESLNLQCDDGGDIIPMMKPVDADLGLPAEGVDGEVIFIHKQPSYTNVIAYHEGEESCTVLAYSGGTAVGIDNPTIAFVPKSCTSVGNTIILSGDPMGESKTGTAYFLYKNEDGQKRYKYLGDHIPVPNLKFAPENMQTVDYEEWKTLTEEEKIARSIGSISHHVPAGGAVAAHKIFSLGTLPVVIRASADAPESDRELTSIVVDQGLYKFLNWSYGTKNEVVFDPIKSIVDRMWAQIEELINYNSSRGVLNMPIFIRYAIRMYDGTHYGVSIPILVSPQDMDGSKDIIKVDIQNCGNQHGTSGSGTDPDYTEYIALGAYQLSMNYFLKFMTTTSTSMFEGWDDLIESVDIFASKMITPYPDKTKIRPDESSVTHSNERLLSGDNDFYTRFYASANLDPWGLQDYKEQEKNILGYSNFYLVKSYTLDEYKELSSNLWISLQDDMNVDPDHLSVLEALKEEDSYQSNHRFLSLESTSYNKRMIAWNVSQILSSGYSFAHSSMLDPQPNQYEIWYHLNTEEGVERVVYGGIINDETWYSWIAYPDSRCYKVTFKWLNPTALYEFDLGTIKMKPHPSLNIAYAFCGLDYRLVGVDNFFVETDTEPTEDNIEYITGQILQSEFANPWSFPAAGRITVGDGNIVGVGIITKPLSSGQFGQFDMYVFTDEGIWALSSNSEGLFSIAKPMSRDVAYPGSIATLDQSIALITDKGVMMLAGGDIVCASESLYGKSDTPSWLPDTLRNTMSSEWVGEIASQMENQEPFMNFIKGGRIAYDYAGRRLLVYNPGHPFMYVYMLTANTWHRMDASAVAGTPVNALNSYPDCNIVCSDGTTGYRKIWDFSTFLHEAEGQETLPGVFVTRPLNLESIDVYKSIQHLLIRYETDPSSVVKYLLLASDDLRTWRVMHSLKGPSHKYYRIAVIASLVPGDRIDYIELDFLNKFNWRLR